MTILKLSLLILTSAFTFANTIYGKASWYGPRFQGKLTASGTKFNMYSYTAAHKTLPLGTLIKVTNLKNKKWVYVKINDRGPYAHNRVLDLSYLAAKKIGLVASGISNVKIDIVK